MTAPDSLEHVGRPSEIARQVAERLDRGEPADQGEPADRGEPADGEVAGAPVTDDPGTIAGGGAPPPSG